MQLHTRMNRSKIVTECACLLHRERIVEDHPITIGICGAVVDKVVVITIHYLAGFELFKRGRAIMLRFVAVDTRDIEATTRQTCCKQPITHHHHIIRRREEKRREEHHNTPQKHTHTPRKQS